MATRSITNDISSQQTSTIAVSSYTFFSLCCTSTSDSIFCSSSYSAHEWPHDVATHDIATRNVATHGIAAHDIVAADFHHRLIELHDLLAFLHQHFV